MARIWRGCEPTSMRHSGHRTTLRHLATTDARAYTPLTTRRAPRFACAVSNSRAAGPRCRSGPRAEMAEHELGLAQLGHRPLHQAAGSATAPPRARKRSGSCSRITICSASSSRTAGSSIAAERTAAGSPRASAR
jgi:hypothetical protein